MGTRIGQFRTIQGDLVTVTFTGNYVADGTLTLSASPVVIQMDGGSEYTAVKYATASVTCIVDGMANLDIFSPIPLSVSVTITNTTTGALLFCGYVTPNSYNQTITGVNDELTIECVDWLGAAKATPYRLVNEAAGMQVLTLQECLRHIAQLLGSSAKIKLCKHLRIVNGLGDAETGRYDLLTLNESYFFSSTTPEEVDGVLTFKSLAMTCYDVLKMVGESLRSTWLQISDTIYLYDNIQHHSNGRALYGLMSGGDGLGLSQFEGDTLEVTAGNLEGEVQISTLSRYSRFSLERNHTQSIDLLHDPFDKTFLSTDSQTYNDYTEGSGSSKKNIRAIILKSKLYDTHYVDSHTFSNFVGYYEYQPSSLYDSPYDKNSVYGDARKTWNNVLRILSSPGGVTMQKIFSQKIAFRTATQMRDSLYLNLQIEAAFSRDTSRLYPYQLIERGTAMRHFKIGMSLKVGDKFYKPHANANTGEWVNEETVFNLYFANGTSQNVEWFSNIATYQPWQAPYDFNLGAGGGVEISLWLTDSDGDSNITEWYACYIRKLQLSVIPGPLVNWGIAGHPLPQVESRGTWGYDSNYDTVVLPIELREPLADKWWGTNIQGVEYMGASLPNNQFDYPRVQADFSFVANPEKYDEGRYTMLERIEKLATMGDGIEMQMTITDNNNEISPLTALISSLWSGRKVITAYTKNIANNSIQLTIQ